jgi:hypothetical protein
MRVQVLAAVLSKIPVFRDVTFFMGEQFPTLQKIPVPSSSCQRRTAVF